MTNCGKLANLVLRILYPILGKSTTVALLERFYDPLSGSIELDGINLKDINVHHLRSLIGYVGQEPVLFATSIAANIKYGNPSATQEQIEAAAKMAQEHGLRKVTVFVKGPGSGRESALRALAAD